MTGSTLGKEYIKAVYCRPAYLAYTQSTGLEEAQLESRFLGEISIISDMQMTPAESEEELKSLLMKVKEESQKVGLKLCIQKPRS